MNKRYEIIKHVKNIFATENPELWQIKETIQEVMKDHACPYATKIALCTVASCASWQEQFSGEISCLLPSTRDCLTAWKTVQKRMHKKRPLYAFVYTWDGKTKRMQMKAG